jgi:hypothetical protein
LYQRIIDYSLFIYFSTAEVRYKSIELFIENKERYSYRRIHALLKRENIIILEKIVCRIMREELLFVKTKKYVNMLRWSSGCMEYRYIS